MVLAVVSVRKKCADSQLIYPLQGLSAVWRALCGVSSHLSTHDHSEVWPMLSTGPSTSADVISLRDLIYGPPRARNDMNKPVPRSIDLSSSKGDRRCLESFRSRQEADSAQDSLVARGFTGRNPTFLLGNIESLLQRTTIPYSFQSAIKRTCKPKPPLINSVQYKT